MYGTTVGRLQATDRDIGVNAEMTYSIISGDGMDMFDISADKDTQEGIITVNKVREINVINRIYKNRIKNDKLLLEQ